MTRSTRKENCRQVGGVGWIMAVILFAAWGCQAPQKSAQEWIQQGIRHFQEKEYTQAADAYRQAVEKKPGNAPAHNLLGMAYRFQYNQSGDPAMREREIAAFRRAVELNPGFIAAIKNLAASLKRDGHHEEAGALARRTLELYPQDPEKPLLESWIRQAGEKNDSPDNTQ